MISAARPAYAMPANEKIGAMATGRQEKVRGVPLARLRSWLVAGLVLLLVVLAGLLGYARRRARQLMKDLPEKLGLHVTSETDGFTLSQSVKGRTVFTVHASKAIQHENGKTTLHNVAITLYGPPGSNRVDSIRGDVFEYDQPNGVLQALGEAHLDLASPGQVPPNAKDSAKAPKRIQVTTHGLVYLQKLGVAATDEPLQIVYGDLRGSAVGADYDSDQGMLRLRKDVHMDGIQDGKPLHVIAADAQMDRVAEIAVMHAAHVKSGDDLASGDLMTFHMSKEGNIEAVNTDGHAMVGGAKGMQAESDRMVARLTATGKLQEAKLDGGVRFQADSTTGSSDNALLHFDAAGQPSQIDLMRTVHVDSTSSSGEQDALTADRVVAHLMQDGRSSALRDAVATGNAVLRSVNTTTQSAKGAAATSGTQTTLVHADELHAVTAASGATRYVSAIDGTGRTRIDQTSPTGEVRTSSGDTLHATLLPPGAKTASSTSGQLQTAMQMGHVIVTQHVPASAVHAAAGSTPADQDTRATAQRADFDGATQRLVLTGTPVVTGTGVQLAADRVSLTQTSGDTDATGSVRGTFVQQNNSSTAPAAAPPDPVHVLADHATIAGSGGTAEFFGGAKPARMWNTTSQLDAPEIELDRTHGTLAAHSATPSAQPAVHLSLPPSPKSTVGKNSTVQITGQQLNMTSATAAVPGQLIVTGQTRMRTADTTVTSERIVAVLHNESKKDSNPTDKTAELMGSGVESVTATGNVFLQQPGRNGTGAKLLYTSADGRYQLTGTPSALPRINDSARGTITGTSLIFHGEDDSVEVAGEPGRRVHTETEAGRTTRSR